MHPKNTAQQRQFCPNTSSKRKGHLQHTFNNGSSSASDYTFREQPPLNMTVTRKKRYIQGTNTIGVHRTSRGTKKTWVEQQKCIHWAVVCKTKIEVHWR